MGLLTQNVNIVISNHNYKYYVNKGYDIDYIGQIININIADLKYSSSMLVLFRCDFCGEVFYRKYNYYTSDKHSQWCACRNCVGKKRKEVFKLEFGVDNIMQLDSIKEKIYQTNYDKYGCKIGLQNPEIRAKQKQTNLEKYGTEYAIAAQQTRNKIQKTMRYK